MFKAINDVLWGNTRKAGFQITLENGVTVSTMFGYGNYCDAKYEGYNPETGCKDAEIALWDSTGKWITEEVLNCGDDITGYKTPNDLVEILYKASKWKSNGGVTVEIVMENGPYSKNVDQLENCPTGKNFKQLSDWSGASVSVTGSDWKGKVV
jgi:hypothetical protein